MSILLQALPVWFLVVRILPFCESPILCFPGTLPGHASNEVRPSSQWVPSLTERLLNSHSEVQSSTRPLLPTTWLFDSLWVAIIIRMLVQLTKTLEEVPKKRYIFCRLVYHDCAPEEYEPQVCVH